jgi:hypothetical protein
LRRRRGFAAASGGGSSGNHVNMTPAVDSTRVWPGRKRARRGTRLRGYDEAPGRGRRATARCGGEAPASNRARRRMGNGGEKGRRGSSPRGGAVAAAAEQ